MIKSRCCLRADDKSEVTTLVHRQRFIRIAEKEAENLEMYDRRSL